MINDEKVKIILRQIIDLEKSYEYDENIHETKVIKDIRRILEDTVNAFEID